MIRKGLTSQLISVLNILEAIAADSPLWIQCLYNNM